MAVTRDQELEAFKAEIDLRAFAADLGYTWDRKESWRGSSVMRHQGTGDKIIIKRDADGHMVYFSVRDDNDNGSIIDFFQKRRRCSLGQVRQALRPWLGHKTAQVPLFPALQPTSKDRLEVEKQFQRMKDAPAHPYLVSERGIPPALLASESLAGRIRIDGRGNAVFPHFDEEGCLCGYEVKNRGFTGFAKGGEKGLWFSHKDAADKTLVVAEGAIDALSYAALFPAPHVRLASIGGQVNPKQPELIKAMIARLPEGARIVAAMDNDADGGQLIEMVASALSRADRRDLSFMPHQPSLFKDWNDALRSPEASSPTALIVP